MEDEQTNTDTVGNAWAGFNPVLESAIAASEVWTRSLQGSIGVLPTKDFSGGVASDLAAAASTVGLLDGLAPLGAHFQDTIMGVAFEASLQKDGAEAQIRRLERAAGIGVLAAGEVSVDAGLTGVPDAFSGAMRAIADQEAKCATLNSELSGVPAQLSAIQNQIASAGLAEVETPAAPFAGGLLASALAPERFTSLIGDVLILTERVSVADMMNESSVGLLAAAVGENSNLVRSLEESALASARLVQGEMRIEKMFPSVSRLLASEATKAFSEMLERVAVDTVFPTLGKVTLPEPLVVIRETEAHRLLVVERFQRQWRGGQHWFLLSLLSEDDHYLLAGLEPREMEDALESALEQVVLDGEYTQLLVSALDNAPYLDTLQRKDLRRGLTLAQQGEFDDALHQFLAGMEGALWKAGEGLEVVDEGQRQLQKLKQPKADSIEPVFKQLPAREGFSTFLVYKVYGGRGNHARHGRTSFPRRQHVLCLVVALAGWMDTVMEVPALEVLGQMLRDALDKQ